MNEKTKFEEIKSRLGEFNLEEIKSKLADWLKGCQNHPCYVKKAEGMGTNGRCRCADRLGSRIAFVPWLLEQLDLAKKIRMALRQGQRELQHRVEKAESEVESERKAGIATLARCGEHQRARAVAEGEVERLETLQEVTELALKGSEAMTKLMQSSGLKATTRAEKAEAEVVRLRKHFSDCICVACEMWREEAEPDE